MASFLPHIMHLTSISHHLFYMHLLLHYTIKLSELVQLLLNIKTSVGDSTPTEAKYGEPLPFREVGVLR